MSQKNYIIDNAALDDVVALIRCEKLVALDTEFTREKTYYPILSLIQIALKTSEGQKLFVVDALSGVDLEPLIAIIFDKNITKIFHASLQDLQIFCQKSGMDYHDIADCLGTSIIDTQIIANFCGFSFNSGYSSLVETLFNKKIDKTLQRSDWQRRPLSSEQIEYALSDVLFLQEIYEILWQKLCAENRQQWYMEEMEIFIKKVLNESSDNLFKNFSFKGRSREQMMRIKNLLLWREEWAKKLDLPRQHFMRDYVIERIAYSNELNHNLDEQKLSEIREIFDKEVDHQDKIFVKDDSHFMNDRQKNLYKKAKDLISQIAAEEGLKEQILITSQALRNLVCSKKPVEESLLGWRYQLCGERLKNLISQ